MLLLICKWRNPIKYLASRDKELARVFITVNRAALIFQKANSCPNRSRGCHRLFGPCPATVPALPSSGDDA